MSYTTQTAQLQLIVDHLLLILQVVQFTRVVVVSNVQGDFVAGETITGGTSSNTAVIQADVVGLKGVTAFDILQVKQIAMAGSFIYYSIHH